MLISGDGAKTSGWVATLDGQLDLLQLMLPQPNLGWDWAELERSVHGQLPKGQLSPCTNVIFIPHISDLHCCWQQLSS